jgi:hypothetical protein
MLDCVGGAFLAIGMLAFRRSTAAFSFRRRAALSSGLSRIVSQLLAGGS